MREERYSPGPQSQSAPRKVIKHHAPGVMGRSSSAETLKVMKLKFSVTAQVTDLFQYTQLRQGLLGPWQHPGQKLHFWEEHSVPVNSKLPLRVASVYAHTATQDGYLFSRFPKSLSVRVQNIISKVKPYLSFQKVSSISTVCPNRL